jgi:hypothetical protein
MLLREVTEEPLPGRLACEPPLPGEVTEELPDDLTEEPLPVPDVTDEPPVTEEPPLPGEVTDEPPVTDERPLIEMIDELPLGEVTDELSPGEVTEGGINSSGFRISIGLWHFWQKIVLPTALSLTL